MERLQRALVAYILLLPSAFYEGEIFRSTDLMRSIRFIHNIYSHRTHIETILGIGEGNTRERKNINRNGERLQALRF